MKYSVISADIIGSTSLNDEDKLILSKKIEELFLSLRSKFDIYIRLIKGDYIECVVVNPADGLRLALAIKCFIKSIALYFNTSTSNRRMSNFTLHGIRLAIGYGELTRYSPENGIIDGEAIYLSGRTIHEASTYNKERVVIKNTLYFASKNEALNNTFTPIMALLDVILSKTTARQSEVLYLKLTRHSENEIASLLGVSQSVINQHSTAAGWNAVEKAVSYFHQMTKNQ